MLVPSLPPALCDDGGGVALLVEIFFHLCLTLLWKIKVFWYVFDADAFLPLGHKDHAEFSRISNLGERIQRVESLLGLPTGSYVCANELSWKRRCVVFAGATAFFSLRERFVCAEFLGIDAPAADTYEFFGKRCLLTGADRPMTNVRVGATGPLWSG